MQLHRIIRIAAVTLGFAAVAAPVASARPDIYVPPVPAHQDLSGFYRPVAPHHTDKAPNIALRHAGGGTCGTDYSRNSVDGGYCATTDARANVYVPPVVDTNASGLDRPAQSVDLRSPDARDAARGVSPHTTAPVATATSKSDDTDWGKIGIIGGSVLGGLALFALGFVLFTRRIPVLSR
jgi:hypothetical protein